MKRTFFYSMMAVTIITSFALTACKKDVTGVTLNQSTATLAPGSTLTLVATVQPEKTANKAVTWKSSDPLVATVSNNGLVTAIKEGAATITVTTDDGGKTAYCLVTVSSTVINPTNSMTMQHSSNYVELYIGGIGEMTIDWGDGTKETHTLSPADNEDGDFEYSHSYSGLSSHIVTISGGTITFSDCSDNNLTHLDVSKITSLIYLDCGGNNLTSLDVSKITALEVLSCKDNQIRNLNVNGATSLMELACDFNRIANLDVSKNTALIGLSCWDNELTNLDVSKNTQLEYLDLDDNLFSGSALNATFGTLQGNPPIYGSEKILYIEGNSGEFDCNKSIAENKGWTVYGSEDYELQQKSRIAKKKSKSDKNAFFRTIKRKA